MGPRSLPPQPQAHSSEEHLLLLSSFCMHCYFYATLLLPG